MKRLFVTMMSALALTMLCGVVTLAAPVKVNDLKQTAATDTTVTLQWTPVEGAAEYRIYDYTNGTLGSVLKTTNNASAAVHDLKQDSVYQYAVVAEVGEKSNASIEANCTEIKAKTNSGMITGLYGKKKNKSSVYLYFSKKSNADGYEIRTSTYNNKKKSKIVTTKKNSKLVVSGIKADQFYKINVRAFININGKRSYSDWTTLQTANEIQIEKKTLSNGIKLKWGEVKGAANYTIYGRKGFSKSRSKYVKLKTTKKTNFTIKKIGKTKLKKKNTYYFFIVANRKDSSTGEKYTNIVKSVDYVTYKAE